MAPLPLLKVDQLVLRSIFKAFEKHCVEHGYTLDSSLYADNEFDRYTTDRQAIIDSKGFCIDLFSESSDRYKGMKNMPRIALLLSRVYDGEIGNALTEYVRNGDNYDKVAPTGKTANLIIAVHLISITSEQSFVLNSIYSNVLGMRTTIPYYTDADQRFFTYQTNFSDIDNAIDNIKEKVYFQTVPDAVMAQAKVIQENVVPLKQIDVDTFHGDTQLDHDTII